MWERGVLDTTQMAGAFQLLRSNDLIWSRITRDYLMGKAAPYVEGSWWLEWSRWLTAQSGEPCEPPRIGVGQAHGHTLPDAPGDYVRQ